MKITLETNRLLLRPFKMEDAKDMFEGWTSDDEVTKYLSWNTHKSIDDTISILTFWIDQYKKSERLNCAIVLKENNQLIGSIDVCGYINDVPIIGYTLSRKYWNNGYMTEACQKVINYLFELGYNQVKIDAAVDNIGSNKVIKKCGGTYIETTDDYVSKKDMTMQINRYIVYKK